ncbi:hypothetical protein AJ78_05844 [Emergomyces pasteurianus Ep9510]|uniref:Fungal-type protein kinase domain-containing protein n=1 Tax=Emergomyces pasteurianus Ep9510 TaxID=1447872 RepID=A0A1J9QCS1_9EURO|nr:hypothetical protein AJ78_05844 [Emergomyces pasteurianus Ep9510]
MAREIKNVVRYYHHETVCIGGQEDDVLTIRQGLSVPISKMGRVAPRRPWGEVTLKGGKKEQHRRPEAIL